MTTRADNMYWCDNCGVFTNDLGDITNKTVGHLDITWCARCGRLDDGEGTVNPSISPKVMKQVWQLARKALNTDGAHHKQHYLEEILVLVVGEPIAADLWGSDQWEEGVAP